MYWLKGNKCCLTINQPLTLRNYVQMKFQNAINQKVPLGAEELRHFLALQNWQGSCYLQNYAKNADGN